MAIAIVESMLWRKLNKTNIKAIFRSWESEGGSVQSFINIPGDREEIAEFFGLTDWEGATERTVVLHPVPVRDYPESDKPIEVRSTPSRRDGEWFIKSESVNYPLWSSDNGFIPKLNELIDEDSDELMTDTPPMIYFVRDMNGRYHARTLYDTSSDRLDRCPSLVRDALMGSTSGVSTVRGD